MMKPHCNHSNQEDHSNQDTNLFWNTKPLPKEADFFSSEIDPLTMVRCPVCSFPLIAIMSKHGPRFSCGCKGFER